MSVVDKKQQKFIVLPNANILIDVKKGWLFSPLSSVPDSPGFKPPHPIVLLNTGIREVVSENRAPVTYVSNPTKIVKWSGILRYQISMDEQV